jgi:hypothetical protein
MMRIQQAERKMFELETAIPTAISDNFSSERALRHSKPLPNVFPL